MIIDTLNNLEKYISVNPLFAVVADFIKENDLSALEPGKHVIKGDEVFVNIQVAKGKTVEEAVLVNGAEGGGHRYAGNVIAFEECTIPHFCHGVIASTVRHRVGNHDSTAKFFAVKR